MRVTVTGGAGYIGSALVTQLLGAGHQVRAVDRLLFDQRPTADALAADGAELVVGDIRDPGTRARALARADAIVHLAAIVGDPACAREPELATQTNVDASRALLAEAHEAGLERVVFASTCSNYGRCSDPTVVLDETAPLRPLSLYARQKVEIETDLLANGARATCLRFATVYGVSRRMRFDLTVNEFTRDLWAQRRLEVFGERFWRSYVHVEDAARAVAQVLGEPDEKVIGRVFNVGHGDDYTKRDLVERIIARLGRGEVAYVHREEDPRDYRVSFERIREELGYVPELRVPDGIDELIEGLEAGRFGDPFSPAHSNIGRPRHA